MRKFSIGLLAVALGVAALAVSPAKATPGSRTVLSGVAVLGQFPCVDGCTGGYFDGVVRQSTESSMPANATVRADFDYTETNCEQGFVNNGKIKFKDSNGTLIAEGTFNWTRLATSAQGDAELTNGDTFSFSAAFLPIPTVAFAAACAPGSTTTAEVSAQVAAVITGL